MFLENADHETNHVRLIMRYTISMMEISVIDTFIFRGIYAMFI